MLLNDPLRDSGLPVGLAHPEIRSLACDSRQVSEGALFFGLPGVKTDGAEYAAQAFERGAAAVVLEKPPSTSAGPVVVVPNARHAMSAVADVFFGHPSRSLKCLGVTGTNGKTTTAFLIRHLMEAAGPPCGLVGTVKYVIGSEEIDAPRTTPESLELQSLLARMRDAGSGAAAMEVSSHALAQSRADHIAFDAAIFTNLTQDHLDYHKTMEAYFEAKAHLFDLLATNPVKKGRAVINLDDRYGHRLIERCQKAGVKTLTFGRGVHADFRATAIRAEGAGTTFQLDARGKSFLVRLPLIGLFNVYNALGALAAVTTCGVELRRSIAALASAPQVPGRLQRVPAKRNFHVYVDYAHTDDALRNVLRTLRELEPGKLITVFGCGGDRDRAKRPLMAAAAEEFSDWTIVTSDNPRTEDPQRIFEDIRTGLRGPRHELVPDRAEAIRKAVALAGAGDIVVIAGKGHETYQEFANGRVPFDDVAVAARAIADKPSEI